MRVQCPECQNRFSAKVNARRIKCPECGFRENAPEEGFAAAFATGKRRSGFQPTEPRPAASSSTRTQLLVAGAVLLLVVAGVAAWAFTRTGEDGCTFSRDSLDLRVDTNPVAVMDLGPDGCLAIELFESEAPLTVQNFRSLVQREYYDGVHFHRILRDFMMQGGDGSQVSGGDPKPPAANIRDEFTPALKHDQAGRLSMANTGQANSGNSQFFIIFRATPDLDAYDASNNLKGCGNPGVSCHAVFGQVVEGMDIVERINREAGRPANDGQNGIPPLRPVTMVRVRMLGEADPSSTSTTTTIATTSTAAPIPNPDCPDVAPTATPAWPEGQTAAGLITPGVWNVCGDTDHMYVWVHNGANGTMSYTFSVTGPGGEPLPDGWSVTFQASSGVLRPSGTRLGQGVGPQNYPDWAATLATVRIPAGQAAGTVPAELRAGDAVSPFTFHVRGDRGTVTKTGDSIQTCYDLYGEAGDRVQAGPFPLKVGADGAVPGYAFGTAGLAVGETATLIVPPPFAYGYGGGGLSGQTLRWATTVTTDPAGCPSFQG